jgi:MoxR-like ATPase
VVRSQAPRARRADFEAAAGRIEDVVQSVSQAIEGKEDVIRLALIGLVSAGHLLIEDVPGVGKTMLAKAIARSTSCSWSRIQFTPDLLPSDVTGVSIYNSRTGKFEFRPGAVFANLVLGDEINRASPKTQSALLEAMEERQVTVDGVTYEIEEPFMVLATQNPLEHEGIFPLPQSQIDRFTMRVRIGYPSSTAEVEILDTHGDARGLERVESVMSPEEVVALVRAAQRVHVADVVKQYIVELCEATRKHRTIQLGASPRASLFLLRTARARAVANGRDYVLPDDVKVLAQSVLAHRLVLTPDAELRGATAESAVKDVLSTVPVASGNGPRRRA